MKRSPLKAPTPEQIRRWQEKQRTPIARTGRPNPRGAKAEREQPALDAFRDALEQRSRGWCEAADVRDPETGNPICGILYRHTGTDAHHLFPEDRDRGVHDPARGKFICRWSHLWSHDFPAAAKKVGLLRPEETP